MSLTRKYGLRLGDQVPLAVANAQAALAGKALREREHAAVEAAAAAVARALKGAGKKPARTTKALRAPAKRRKG